MHWAAYHNKHDAVRKLLALRGDLSLLDQVGLWPVAPACTAVFVAALRVCVLASSRLLLNFELRVDLLAHLYCPAQNGDCPLITAVRFSGDADMVQLLASEYPAAVNLPNKVRRAGS